MATNSPDEKEMAIEALMAEGLDQRTSPGRRPWGRVQRIDDCQARYIEIAKATFPAGSASPGMRIVIDCANGAAYKVAPEALHELGRRGHPCRSCAQRLQHQRGMRLDPSRPDAEAPSRNIAPTSASPSTATPTAW
jgi:phosphomannomutase